MSKNSRYKKIVALIEIVAAAAFGIGEIVGCMHLVSRMSVLSDTAQCAVASYIPVVDHGREVFCESYATLPQHRKTVEEIRNSLISMGETCRRASDKVPDWKWLAPVKELPLNLYKPFGELERSLGSTIVVLDTLDEKKYHDVIAAFGGTRRSLEDAEKLIPGIRNQAVYIIFISTGFLVFSALLVFFHGLVSLLECGDGKKTMTAVEPPTGEK